MKKNLLYLMLFVFGVMGMVSCAEDMEYNNNGTVPVKQLLVPAADAEMVLINNEEATTLFEWTVGDAVTTQKYYVVFYNAATARSSSVLTMVNQPARLLSATIFSLT